MKATIVVTDDHGVEYSGTLDLAVIPKGRAVKVPQAKGSPTQHQGPKLDFTLSCRAFMKEHVTRRTTGPQKFVMLVAWLVKGQTATEVKFDQISREWKKASGLLGGDMANVYCTRAKDNGWVDSPKTGTYVLRTNWMRAFGR